MSTAPIFAFLNDRRKHERNDRTFKMRYSQMEDLSTFRPAQEGKLLDIGGGGIRFLSAESFAKNDQLVIALEVPGWKVADDDWQSTDNHNDIGILTVIGQVMWQRNLKPEGQGFEIGIRFTGQIKVPE